jgi:hypothetical protein
MTDKGGQKQKRVCAGKGTFGSCRFSESFRVCSKIETYKTCICFVPGDMWATSHGAAAESQPTHTTLSLRITWEKKEPTLSEEHILEVQFN